jgi:pimeloyl-ACP methyl ester carboxylesterase
MRLFDKGGSTPLSDINPFLYPVNTPAFNLRFIKQNNHWRHYLVDFPIVSANHYPGAETARGEYFEPTQKNNVPLVILLHGWGDYSVLPFKWMVAGLIRKGIACFILYLPFHNSRLPEEMKSRISHLTQDEWFTGYQMAVTDVRCIIDWAGQNEHINSRQITIIGLSLGAIVGSIAMGIDPRVKAGVFIAHGGNTGKMMQTNSVSRFGRRYRLPDKEYQANQKNYAHYLVEVANKGFENVAPAKRTYLIDPLTYASMLKGRAVLMINAQWDEIFPHETSLDFWRACGQCDRVVFPATHAGIWIWYPLIVLRINKFLRSALNR